MRAGEHTPAEPEIVVREAQRYVGIAASVPMSSLGETAPSLVPRLMGYLAANGAAPAGPPFFRYRVLDMPTRIDLEVGVPVEGDVRGDGDIRVGELPAGRYATAEHQGDPSGLEGATRRLLEWADREHLRWDVTARDGDEVWGSRLEEYLTDPREQPDRSAWRTRLAFRLAD